MESVMKRFIYLAAVLLAAMMFSTIFSFAQTSSGDISGRVVDPSGAAIPNAQVTLTNQLTSQKLTTNTDRSGNFVFPSTQPGTFNITVTASGFKQFDKRDLHLSASER